MAVKQRKELTLPEVSGAQSCIIADSLDLKRYFLKIHINPE